MKQGVLIFLTGLILGNPVCAGFLVDDPPGFERLTLSEEFFSEGATTADIDRDGQLDIVSGPFWYAGPDFRKRFRYSSGRAVPITGYSRHFFSWSHDFNADGWPDLLTIGMPGDPAYWWQNPGEKVKTVSAWKRHEVIAEASNESPAFMDLTGDGRPELICVVKGAYSLVEYRSNPADGTVRFQTTPITENRRFGRFTHGMGIGDVNGDGRPDLLETNGWWEQKKMGELFHFHPYRFAESGGAQMFAADFDGDGDNDVICSQNAHGFGLKWFEQVKTGEQVDFVPHTILSADPADNAYGLAVSQLHAAELCDVDGDGVQDLITGKRFWAHGGRDPGAKQLAVLFWLKTVRRQGRVHFEPNLIDVRSGVGTQVHVTDLNGDRRPDIVIGNKLGTYAFVQNRKLTALAWENQPLQAGTRLFQENIRSTPPLEPEDEEKTFILPPGFEIQLVASEPDIAKPMNLAFDRRGRLWVSSSHEYPFPAADPARSRDTIRILEDTNNDGRADIIKTFADRMNIPMGLIPYGDGVICFSIPYIWFLHDTDGDDQVDRREILYGPFDTTRDTHGMCSSFTLGNDGWIYATHGFNNRSRVKGKDGHEIVMESGNIFRFRPDGSRIELVSHGQVNPFGMAIDSRGDLFTADCHTRPINLVLPGGHHDSFGKPHDGLGYIPNLMEHLHDSTGIGGIALGEYTAFPQVYSTSTFGGNVVTGRINRNRLIYEGSSMTAREEPDFLVPGDPWFRPVNLQIGPDGALYVADFYNRIIGHYEVDLKHPGRDRNRGRIWRVIYTGEPNRRDPQTNFPDPVELKAANLDRIVEELGTTNRTRALSILEWVIRTAQKDPAFLTRFTGLVRQRDHKTDGRLFCWMTIAFGRLGIHTPNLEVLMAQKPSTRVRILGYQLLKEFSANDFPPGKLVELLSSGLVDESPFVRRQAALAAAHHARTNVVGKLVECLNRSARTSDRFLVHSLKIALREQLKASPDSFHLAVKRLNSDSSPAFAEVCLALRSKNSANYLVDNLESLTKQSPGELARYLEFAARYADEKRIDSVVDTLRARFSGDQSFQLTVLESLRAGFAQKNQSVPESVIGLATSIAEKLLDASGSDSETALLGWDYYHDLTDRAPDPERNIFAATYRRRSADGMEKTPLWSSIVNGERKTGVLRSEPFPLPNKFSFFLAGHAGFPDKPMNRLNFVQLRLVKSGKTIARQYPPRNDTAQPVEWDTSQWAGKSAVIELVDQDTATAYAWLAAGRFSVPGLNPSRKLKDRLLALDVIKRFRLNKFVPRLMMILDSTSSRKLRARSAECLLQIRPAREQGQSILSATAWMLSLNSIGEEETDSIVRALKENNVSQARNLLEEFVRRFSDQQQAGLADRLAADRTSSTYLLDLIDKGLISRGVLSQPSVRTRLLAHPDPSFQARFKKLIARLPKVDPRITQVLKNHLASIDISKADIARGQEIFRKNCSACHQYQGEGAKVGPNLDGIGNRGFDRFLEDVLLPNQNVDSAFRASLVATDDGRTMTGFIRTPKPGDQQVTLIDGQGKTISLPKDRIEQIKETIDSPMPANFADTLTAKDLTDLGGFLLKSGGGRNETQRRP